jgi:hypothetical protein
MNLREDDDYESYLISSLNILKKDIGCFNLKFRCTGSSIVRHERCSSCVIHDSEDADEL